MKYTTKVIEVEAMQFDGKNHLDIKKFAPGFVNLVEFQNYIAIQYSRDGKTMMKNDWIVKFPTKTIVIDPHTFGEEYVCYNEVSVPVDSLPETSPIIENVVLQSPTLKRTVKRKPKR